MIKNPVVPNTIAAAGFGQQIGRIGHAFHATGDQHVCAAGQQHVMAKHGCTHARAAHLGQRHRARTDRQAALECGLARRRLTLSGHQTVAEQDLINLIARDPGALHRRLDGNATQIVGGKT